MHHKFNSIHGISSFRYHSIKDSIMSMFNVSGGATTSAIQPGAQQPHQAANGNQNPTQQVTTQNAKTDANGQVPATVPGSDKTAEVKTPLSDFSKVWEPNAPKKDAQGNDIPAAPTNVINIDHKKIMEAAKKTDFSTAVPAELMQKIKAGGDEGIAAYMQAMNIVGQTSYGQAVAASATLTEQALAKAKETFVASIPDIIKKVTAQDSLRAEDPRFNNPAVKPVVDALQAQLALKHPDATASQINDLAKQYFTDMAKEFSPKPTVPTPKSGRGAETDWETLIFGKPSGE